MRKSEQSKEAYNNIAHRYDHTYDGRFTSNFKQDLLHALTLPPNAHVLDVACGNGRLLGMLGARTKIKGYGIDISENMIIEAQKLYPDFNFSVANCNTLPFDSNVFDAITVSASFHHFEQPDCFLKEAQRVLKSGGTLYIAELCYPGLLRCNGSCTYNDPRAFPYWFLARGAILLGGGSWILGSTIPLF